VYATDPLLACFLDNNIESDMLGSIAYLTGQFFSPTMIDHAALAKNAETSSKMYISGNHETKSLHGIQFSSDFLTYIR
jgi:hypothetical protein